jgi:aminoglycoside 3'-phosphotransferase-2
VLLQRPYNKALQTGTAELLGELTALRQVLPQIRGYEPEKVTMGRSTSTVYRLVSPEMPTLFLKTAAEVDAAELIAEYDRLRWLAGRVPVPRVAGFAVDANPAYLLTEGLPGINAADVPARLRPQVTMKFAVELRKLHSIDPGQCPFDRTLEQVLPAARARAMAGRVDEADFDVERLGYTPTELLGPLYQRRPEFEDIVVTHGDACLPNAIFDDGSFRGFVDCGRCGRADRYQDLALAARSINSNFGGNFAAEFFGAYGIDSVDAEKVSYYQLVDEFF